jgi:sugar-specific transcriptional regulator TrmB
MATSDGIAPLIALGFTDLEARVYAYLVAEGPATGYRIASGTGKPVANTYKAIESLERKGAVLVEDGATRIVRAVEPERVLDGLARTHEAERKRATTALKKAARVEEDGRVYIVSSEDQALQRARQMLAEAAVVALVRGSAELRVALKGELADAETRGVDVAEIDGEGLTIAIDAAECLVAPDGIWTRNTAVSLAIFDGLSAEASLGEVAFQVNDGAGTKKLQRALAARRRPPIEA